MQTKPGFTYFRFCTPSLGKLQNFVFIKYSVWEKKMLCIKLPNAHQIFKKHKVVIQKMQQTSQKQKITCITIYIWNWHKIFYQKKLRIGVTLLCDVIDHEIYTYFLVCKYKNSCFQHEGSIKPILKPIFLQ